ncbi:helix-turn-helix domain containing protein [Phenylobacterium sp. LjRoot225]|uniref:TetR/AcrR family transcriptional regulator n=1 Tax=Phenylobacterium sp. LjRoot225 TaxID=3342285 RepID=UPI003ECF9773
MKSSKTRNLLIEAADLLLTEEGYHAISARRVAERAGLKPQLVHYYFQTMDELIVAVFQRACEQDFEQHERALSDPQPLKALWRLHANRSDTKRMMEFIAIGSHRETLRAEIARAAERFRNLQAAAVAKALDNRGIDAAACPPGAMVLLMAAISRALVMETELGVNVAHAELRSMVETFLDYLEPTAGAASE